MADPEYTIYYHNLAGRAEYIRVMLAEAGQSFKEINDRDTIVSKIFQGELGGFPVLFPPVLAKGKLFQPSGQGGGWEGSLYCSLLYCINQR